MHKKAILPRVYGFLIDTTKYSSWTALLN